MGGLEISTDVIPLTNPRALVGLVANLLAGALNVGADTGIRRAVEVVARVDGRVVGRARAWTPESAESATRSMTEDFDSLPLDEFQRRWL